MLERSTLLVFVGLALVTASTPARAQPVEAPASPAPIDPMLQPVPRARLEIASWEDALRNVRARSSDLRVAEQEVARAEAQQRVALAGALPTLLAQGAYTHNFLTRSVPSAVGVGADGVEQYQNVKTPYPDYATGQVVANQPVVALHAWRAIGTAEIATEAARWSFDDARRRIALAVANALVGVVTAERIAELNRVALRNALARLELTTRKIALGGGIALDVMRAKQDVEVTRSNLVLGDEVLREARESLGLALGLSQEVGVSPRADLSRLERDTRRSCREGVTIEDRPDVAALRLGAEAARRGVTDVEYQFAPTVNLQSTLAATTVDDGVTPTRTWNVQALLTVPLWDGGVKYGNLRDARAQSAIADQHLAAGRRDATIEITRVRRGVGVAEERLRAAMATRELSAETERLTRVGFQDGRGTSLELVVAAQALREAEIQLALREFDVVKARIVAALALASCTI